MSSWLPITEYAVKNRVSVSTIRRRIKNHELQHKLEGGKYFVLDEGQVADIHPGTNRTKTIYNSVDEVLEFAERSIQEITKLNQEIINEKDTTINIQKKKIQDLEEELSELKMLINVLEKKHTLTV
jgi:archaellum component FlaC